MRAMFWSDSPAFQPVFSPLTHETVPPNEYLPLNPYPRSIFLIQLTEPAGPSPQPGTPKILNKYLTQESGLNAKYFFFKGL